MIVDDVPSPSKTTAPQPAVRPAYDKDIQERLLPGEVIVTSAVISEGIYWRAAVVFVLSIIVALFVVFELGALLMITAVIMAAHAIIKKSILMLYVTNKRVLVRFGILQVDVLDIHLDKIESMDLERMVTGYFMGYSNVVITGTGGRFMVIPFVANGIQIRRAYNEQVLSEKGSQKEIGE